MCVHVCMCVRQSEEKNGLKLNRSSSYRELSTAFVYILTPLTVTFRIALFAGPGGTRFLSQHL